MGSSGKGKKKKYKEKKERNIWESFYIFFKYVLAALSSLCVVLILLVMPFYFQEGYTHIGSDKSYFFRMSIQKLSIPILVALGLWLLFYIIVTIRNRHKGMVRELFAGMNPTDFFAFFYGLSVILSYLCSNYKETAIWGTTGWYMGMIPQLTLVSLYGLISVFQFKPKWMLWLCMPASAVTFLLGYLNRFDIWPLSMDNSGLPLFISTIGNINWYCGYVVSVLFVGVGLLWLYKGEKRQYTAILAAYVFLGFATLITQGSDSGIFAVAVVFVVLFVLSARDENIDRMRRFWIIVMLFAGSGIFTMMIRFLFPERINYTSSLSNLLTYSPVPIILIIISAAGFILTQERFIGVMKKASKALCIAVPVIAIVFISMIVLNTIKPGSLGGLSDKSVFCFNYRWGSSRGGSWTMGIRSFAEQDLLHKFTGIGPDCMASFLYKGSSPELLDAVHEAFSRRLTNAHCELLTILVNEGILGAVTFAGMMISLLLRFLKVSEIKSREKNIYAAACGLCLLAYLCNNIWSFQQSMSVATIFVIMGLGGRCLRTN